MGEEEAGTEEKKGREHGEGGGRKETVRQGASPLSLSSPGGQWGASVPSSGRVSDDP